ncbi:uncharacterized protein LOC117609294 isoform X1 [Osmia lignaria lignaria]|uniref:uncharacterized protein LOC117609294 isoform X1 n=1 Tax=Osmia lignaria lignaria TaxID=1437193 RepID=UPI0014792445|nr:uncharacterized protein LOC117609294 isoform X1 [Osmia lignaria]
MHFTDRVSLKVAMAVTGLRTVTCFIFYLIVVINARKCYTQSQYTDDSDYKDLEFYEDMPINYIGNYEKDHIDVNQDDFYILSNFEDANVQNDVYPHRNDLQIPFENRDDALKKRSPVAQLNWYKPEKVYRYTKHRIPGYDYEELDYVITRNIQQCDEKSVWTHCLCQFTCSEPDVVDCYTPCKSGCECKEEYVFDEKTQQCSLPEHCSSKDDHFYIT